jgi:DNA-binding IclR family transcriptional regulator
MNTMTPRVEEAVQKLKGVFLEIPGTQLSLVDASRLSGLERNTCRMILEALEDVRFLRREPNGLFVRRENQPSSASWAEL